MSEEPIKKLLEHAQKLIGDAEERIDESYEPSRDVLAAREDLDAIANRLHWITKLFGVGWTKRQTEDTECKVLSPRRGTVDE